MSRRRQRWWLSIPLGLLAGLAVVVYLAFALYRPDRPVATIAPGTSPAPVFVAQIIRPRFGLPLGGLLPPRLFGLEGHLGFDSASSGAYIGEVGPGIVELGADGWRLALVFDRQGRVNSETQVAFELTFEERLLRVRCRPGDPPVGTVDATPLADADELAGSFDVEIARCERAATGAPLGWPAKPLVLHGSFDRLPVVRDADRAVAAS